MQPSLYDGPIFRSTETRDYLQCPTLWYWKRVGYQAKTYSVRDVRALIGRAIHKGAEVFDCAVHIHEDRHDYGRLLRTLPIEEAVTLFMNDREELPVDAPNSKRAADELRAAESTIRRAVEVYCKTDPFAKAGLRVRDAELKLTSTIDRVVVDNEGHRGIADLKTATFTQPYFKNQYIAEFRNSWQMLQYLFEYRNAYEHHVNDVYLALFDLKTMTIDVVPYFVSDLQQEVWFLSARQVWRDMYECGIAKRFAHRVAEHHTRYGKCEMFDICFENSKNHYYAGKNQYATT